MPHELILGATQSGKSVYLRNLLCGLARQPVALVGIDCKWGVELAPFAPRLSALAVALVSVQATLAAAQPVDIGRGRALAETWCATCHVIDREQTSPVPAGPPSFPALAEDPAVTPERLSGFMRDPHPPMPDMSLTRGEVADLVGYIRSLAN